VSQRLLELGGHFAFLLPVSAIFRAHGETEEKHIKNVLHEESAGSDRPEASRQILHGTELNFQGHKL
jgi:hypothetical protein